MYKLNLIGKGLCKIPINIIQSQTLLNNEESRVVIEEEFGINQGSRPIISKNRKSAYLQLRFYANDQ